MTDFEIWLIDDEKLILDSLEFSLAASRSETIRKFLTLLSAREALDASAQMLLLILDHDFPNADSNLSNGYDFADYAKTRFWMRAVLPIIYLTGRESLEGFESKKFLMGGRAPDFYMNKTELHTNKLDELIENLADRLYNFEVAVEEHGLERAIEIFTDPIPN
jgi:CheY-like chemotaxis protein